MSARRGIWLLKVKSELSDFRQLRAGYLKKAHLRALAYTRGRGNWVPHSKAFKVRGWKSEVHKSGFSCCVSSCDFKERLDSLFKDPFCRMQATSGASSKFHLPKLRYTHTHTKSVIVLTSWSACNCNIFDFQPNNTTNKIHHFLICTCCFNVASKLQSQVTLLFVNWFCKKNNILLSFLLCRSVPHHCTPGGWTNILSWQPHPPPPPPPRSPLNTLSTIACTANVGTHFLVKETRNSK